MGVGGCVGAMATVAEWGRDEEGKVWVWVG